MALAVADRDLERAAMQLSAGPISADYQSGSLRYVRCGGVEVLRQIYFALRDSLWGVVPGRILRETVDQGADCFHIEFKMEHRHNEIAFIWEGRIEGSREGALRFTMSGVAASSFNANRIGFCVLHPIDGCAGRDCTIEHTAGTRESAHFPNLIAPHQPFLDVRAISHEVLPGVTARVCLEGDAFETEDHRNWTDYSFKTYSRPLTLPYPYHVPKDECVSQSVSLEFQGSPPPYRATRDSVHLTIGQDLPLPFPEVGRSRIDLHLKSPVWRENLERAGSDSSVECAIFTGEPQEQLGPLLDALAQIRPRISRWLIFDAEGTTTPARAVSAFRPALSRLYPGVPIGGGSNANFAEFNRNRHVVEGLDFVSWGVNPQVHAFDEQTLIENLQAQSHTVATARSFCATLPLAISRIQMPHPSPVAASWVVGSLKYLVESGVKSIIFGDIPGAESVFARIEEFAPERAITSRSSNPLSADMLVLRKGRCVRILLANFLGRLQEVLITDGRGSMRRETLEPYAVAGLDWAN